VAQEDPRFWHSAHQVHDPHDPYHHDGRNQVKRGLIEIVIAMNRLLCFGNSLQAATTNLLRCRSHVPPMPQPVGDTIPKFERSSVWWWAGLWMAVAPDLSTWS
jgi:hypothetical protein